MKIGADLKPQLLRLWETAAHLLAGLRRFPLEHRGDPSAKTFSCVCSSFHFQRSSCKASLLKTRPELLAALEADSSGSAPAGERTHFGGHPFHFSRYSTFPWGDKSSEEPQQWWRSEISAAWTHGVKRSYKRLKRLNLRSIRTKGRVDRTF